MQISSIPTGSSSDSKFDLDNAPYVLLILDGWGIAPAWGGNAIALAETPTYNELLKDYPNSQLQASGREVGLPQGSAGNSEAGHLSIGAGRIVMQDETIINKEIMEGTFFLKQDLKNTFMHAVENHSTVHLLGLLSEAGTHSHINHLFALLQFAQQNNVNNVKIHLFSDGRDSDPMSGIDMLDKVEKYIAENGVGQIASITGRYYAMDRDNRWGRTSRAYNALVQGQAELCDNPRKAFSDSYSRGITDEFIEPRLISNKEQEISTIKDNDVVIIWNFRPDRVRQITMAFLADKIDEFPDRKRLNNIAFLTFTMYEQHFENIPIKHIFAPDITEFPLPRIFSEKGFKQFHIAETEKYAHVTYFFSGGRDNPYPNEQWQLVPSPKVKTYNLTPKMSTDQITSEVLKTIDKCQYAFMVINLANADMVGHTGNLKATAQAVTAADSCLGMIKEAVLKAGGTLIVCADHGNAEQMINPTTGRADTEHTTNPVPFICVRKDLASSGKVAKNGRLGDIAPTILKLAGIEIPDDMKDSSILIE